MKVDFVELWVADGARTHSELTRSFCFKPLPAQGKWHSEDRVLLAWGDVRFALRGRTSDEVTAHVREHGDGIVDVALRCSDVSSVVRRARAHGAEVKDMGDCCRVDLLGDGTILHSIRDSGAASDVHGSLKGKDGVEVGSVDHVAYCVPWGTMSRVVRAYQAVFGLRVIHLQGTEQVGDPDRGMRSVALRSPSGFTVVLTEPLSPGSVGQTQSFVQAHRGAGVQHIALGCEDILQLASLLRSRGVSFLPIRPEDLQESYQRLNDRDLPWDGLSQNGVLVDSDDQGLLFQLFTQPISEGGQFFVEFVQREGSEGFGPNNVRALYVAVDAALKQRAT